MDAGLGVSPNVGGNGPRVHPTRVFVGGLAREASEIELETFFSEYGSVIDVRIVCDKRTGLNKGYGFVTYDSQEARDALLKMGIIDFRGRKLRLRQAVRKKGCGQFDEREDPVFSTYDGGQWMLVPKDSMQTIPTPTIWPQYGMYLAPNQYNYYTGYSFMIEDLQNPSYLITQPQPQPQPPHYQQGTAYYYYV